MCLNSGGWQRTIFFKKFLEGENDKGENDRGYYGNFENK